MKATWNLNDTNLISILSPILLTIGGIVSWLLKSKKEETLNAEIRSREYKIQTYKTLLNPFIATLTTTILEKNRQKEIDKIKTLEYKKASFDLTTFGSDRAIKIFNKIMQTFYHSDEFRDDNGNFDKENYGNRLIALMSEFLLVIRKDLYKSNTKLNRSEMLEFMITDMRESAKQINDMKI